MSICLQAKVSHHSCSCTQQGFPSAGAISDFCGASRCSCVSVTGWIRWNVALHTCDWESTRPHASVWGCQQFGTGGRAEVQLPPGGYSHTVQHTWEVEGSSTLSFQTLQMLISSGLRGSSSSIITTVLCLKTQPTALIISLFPLGPGLLIVHIRSKRVGHAFSFCAAEL